GFIENRGQIADDVRFYLREGMRTVWATEGGISFTLRRKISEGASRELEYIPARLGCDETSVTTSFVSPSERLRLAGAGKAGSQISYPVRSGALTTSSFAHLFYEEVWNGIDLRLHRESGALEEVITVRPGADSNEIR